MFVAIGFDDNGRSGLPGSGGAGGMSWALRLLNSHTNPKGNGNIKTYDGTRVTGSFYMTSAYIAKWIYEHPGLVKQMLAPHHDGRTRDW